MYKQILIILAFASIIFTQQITVQGKILDASTGNPIVGVSIYSGQIGAVSDVYGAFVIEIPAESEIIIKMIGYEDHSFNANNEPIVIRLKSIVLEGPSIDTGSSRRYAGGVF